MEQPVELEILNLKNYAHYLKPRARDWHKGLSGHVLIIGGDLGFSGAVRMAAEAALRVGAGLVSVATHPLHAGMLNLTRPEIMCHGIAINNELDHLLVKADVVIVGPGLGQSDWSKMMWSQACLSNKPKLVDADGLNWLAQAPFKCSNWVLTPHPGEAGRLLSCSTSIVQQDRMVAIRKIVEIFGGVCVLKGMGSLVLGDNVAPAICHKGNPGMASAGMGDVLSGVIGGLMAQGIPIIEAAKIGVYIHAVAGDDAATAGERGLLAMDLMPYLRQLVNNIG